MGVPYGREVSRWLSHGWRVTLSPGLDANLLRDFVRPAVRAVPRTMATRLSPCQISLQGKLTAEGAGSQWKRTDAGLDVAVASEEIDGHDLALDVLLCLGQALWETTSGGERTAYLKVLAAELEAEVSGEIDEEALSQKQLLYSGLTSARSLRRLEQYTSTSFAGTVTEYVHSLWHDVTIRTGPEYLPAFWLRHRLDLLARWFPPDRGHHLYPRKRKESPTR